MPSLNTLDGSLRRNFTILFITGVLFWSSLATLLPVLPLYVRDGGGNEQEVGLVMGALAVGLLLSRVWVTRLTDRRGRKVVLLLGLGVGFLALIGFALIQFIPGLIVLRALSGVSIAAFGTAYAAIVVDLTPEHRRGELVGYMSLVNPLGLALGPALGGIIQKWAGYTWVFLGAAAVALVGGIFCLWIQEPVLDMGKERKAGDQAFWTLLTRRSVLIPTFVFVMIGMAFGTVSTFVPLYIEDAHLGFNAGLFYSALAVASFGARFITGRASDRYGRGLFIAGSLVLYTLSMALLWTARTETDFLIAGAIEGLASGTLFPVIIALAADRSRPEERVRVLSLCMGGFDLGMAFAGPVMGALATELGLQGLFGVAVGLSFMAFFVFVTQSLKTLAESLSFALGRTKDRYALPPIL